MGKGMYEAELYYMYVKIQIIIRKYLVYLYLNI